MFGLGKKKQPEGNVPTPTVKKSGSSKKSLILKSVVILVVLSLGSYGGYLYVESVKAKSYVEGGNAAIDMVRQAADAGGVEIEMGGEVVKLTKYHKPIGEKIISKAIDNTAAAASDEDTNSSEGDDTNSTNSTS